MRYISYSLTVWKGLSNVFFAYCSFIISAKWTKWMAVEITAFVRCVCVCLCVRSGRSCELNANSSKTVKATDFKFDIRVSRDSRDMIPKNIIQKGAWPRSRDPLNFWALNANSSKTVKATDFKFDTRVPRHSPDMTPTNFPKTWRL